MIKPAFFDSALEMLSFESYFIPAAVRTAALLPEQHVSRTW
jgi:hypothetical protein